MVGPSLIFGHFIHTTPEILADAVRAGASMTWNPLSNGRLGSGTADVVRYREQGLRIGMGLDGEASADRADPFANMRAGLYQIRAMYRSAAVLSPYDVLRMHTVGSAEVLHCRTGSAAWPSANTPISCCWIRASSRRTRNPMRHWCSRPASSRFARCMSAASRPRCLRPGPICCCRRRGAA